MAALQFWENRYKCIDSFKHLCTCLNISLALKLVTQEKVFAFSSSKAGSGDVLTAV